MLRIRIMVMMLTFFLFVINSQENKTSNPVVINVERGINNLSRLKVSDFGKTIRYIPLETTDESIIGANPVVKVLKDFIIVEYPIPTALSSNSVQGVCLLFSKKDGRFISKIGHFGQNPAAYTNCFSWTDENEEFLYFQRMPNQLIKYDMKGNFCGKVEFLSSGLASYYIITNSSIIGYFDQLSHHNSQFALRIFDNNGILKDSVSAFLQNTKIGAEDILGLSIFQGTFAQSIYGSWARTGVFIFQYKNSERHIIPMNTARVWKNNNVIRFKQDFVDTIFTVSGSKLIPSFVFYSGRFRWPEQERRSTRNTNERIFIADISENNSYVFFQCIRGLYAGLDKNDKSKPILYHCLYYKKTGEIKIGRNSDGIEDDLTHFMKFKPLGMSTAGEFVSFIEAWEVLDWIDNHPQVKNNSKLSFLKEFR